MKNLTWQNPEQLFVAQELINKVKSKCCGIKVIQVNDRGLLDVIGACDGVVIKKNFVEYVTVPKILNAKEAVAGILWAAVIMETEQLKK